MEQMIDRELEVKSRGNGINPAGGGGGGCSVFPLHHFLCSCPRASAVAKYDDTHAKLQEIWFRVAV